MKMLIVNFEYVYNSADLTKRNTWNLNDRFSIVRSFMRVEKIQFVFKSLNDP